MGVNGLGTAIHALRCVVVATISGLHVNSPKEFSIAVAPAKNGAI
jgi:hypothetical protein